MHALLQRIELAGQQVEAFVDARQEKPSDKKSTVPKKITAPMICGPNLISILVWSSIVEFHFDFCDGDGETIYPIGDGLHVLRQLLPALVGALDVLRELNAAQFVLFQFRYPSHRHRPHPRAKRHKPASDPCPQLAYLANIIVVGCHRAKSHS